MAIFFLLRVSDLSNVSLQEHYLASLCSSSLYLILLVTDERGFRGAELAFSPVVHNLTVFKQDMAVV